MDDENLVRQGGDELISPARGAGVGAARGLLEARDDQEAAGFQGRPPSDRNPHFLDCPRGTDDNGLLSLKKNSQALFFYRRVKTTNHSQAIITQFPNRAICSDSGFARATDGTKQANLSLSYNFQASDN